jgi:hypothetical protein
LPSARALGNLSDLSFQVDRYDESLRYLDHQLTDARASGERAFEWFALSEMTFAMWMLGRWDEALETFAQLPEDRLATGGVLLSPLNSILEIRLARGEVESARHLLHVYDRLQTATDLQEQGAYGCALAALAMHEGRYADALQAAERVFDGRAVLGLRSQQAKLSWMYAVEAALHLGNRERAEELVAEVAGRPVGLRAPFLDAHLQLFRARLGPPGQAEPLIAAGESRFRERELPYWLARCLLQRAEACAAIDEAEHGERYAAEAREILDRLGVSGQPVASPV